MRWIVTSCLLGAGLTFVSSTNAQAQIINTGSSHILTIGGGIQLIKDDVLSLSEDLSSASLTWSFSNSNRYRKKSILFSFEKASGNAAKSSLHSTEFMFQYANAFSLVKNKLSRWNNYTGYSFSINPEYIRSGDQYSWASANSISLYNSLEYSRPKSILSVDITVPLAGLGSRPDINTAYKGSVNDMLYNSFSNLRFTSLHNLKAVTISLRYQQSIGNRLFFTGGASYNYKDMMINKRFMRQAYGIHAGLSYHVE